MIARGTSITFNAKGSTGEWIPRTPDDVRSEAINFMSDYFVVESMSITRTSNSILREWWDYGYDAEIHARTLQDHAGIDELIKIVSDALHDAAGEPATVSAKGYTPDQQGGTGGTYSPPSFFGLSLGVFALAAIAVAIFVWKKT